MYFYGLLHLATEIQEATLEKKFYESIKEMPLEQKIERMKFHRIAKQEIKKEAEIERRHQELISAIRSQNKTINRFYF